VLTDIVTIVTILAPTLAIGITLALVFTAGPILTLTPTLALRLYREHLSSYQAPSKQATDTCSGIGPQDMQSMCFI